MATLTYTTGCGTFAFVALYKTRVASRPILDEAQRTTVCVEHTIDVDGYVTSPVGTRMAQAKENLTACGGHLVYQDKGNDIVVNAPGSNVRDCRWGPIPEVLDFTPLGGDCNAARIHWRVKTYLPECCEVVASVRKLMALNYEVTHTIDQDGYSSQTVYGYAEIPVTRTTQTNRVPPDVIDRYRETLQTTVPLGFQRTNQVYNISKDRRRIDFSWIDRELPSPLPVRTTTIQARQSVDTDCKGWSRWTFSLDATITMARGARKSESLEVFLRLLNDRLRRFREADTVAILPTRFVAGEDIFGRSSSFAFQATIVKPSAMTVAEFLNRSKLWYPIEGTDYQQWRRSLEDDRYRTQGVRGYAQLEYLTSDDYIVDLCDNTGSSGNLISRTRGLPNPGDSLIPREPRRDAPRDTDESLNLVPRTLTPERSWFDYDIWLQLHENPETVIHKLLPREPLTGFAVVPEDTRPESLTGYITQVPEEAPRSQLGAAGGNEDLMRSQIGGEGFSRQGNAPIDPVQKIASPTRHILLGGHGVRLGWRVPVPALTTVGGVTPVEVWRWIWPRQIGEVGGVPLHRTDWRVLYALPKAPSGALPTLANPVLGYDGGTGADLR